MKLSVGLLSVCLTGSVLGRPSPRACHVQRRDIGGPPSGMPQWDKIGSDIVKAISSNSFGSGPEGFTEGKESSTHHHKVSTSNQDGPGTEEGSEGKGSVSDHPKGSPSNKDGAGAEEDSDKEESSSDSDPFKGSPSNQDGAGAEEGSRGKGKSTTNHGHSSSWSGAVLKKPSSGHFESVTGRFKVPRPKHVGSAGKESAAVWVGIDGETCHSGLIQAGVDLEVSESGDVSYSAWYEWYPALSETFHNFKISEGDVIQIDVTATSTTKGTTKITNVSTGQTLSKTLEAPGDSKLCRGNAEWIVEKFSDANDKTVPWSNFGTVVFEAASAKLSGGGTQDLTDADIIDLQDKKTGTVYTDVAINNGSSVTVQYVEKPSDN